MYSYILIAVGLILIVISFFISEKLDESLGVSETMPSQGRDIWTEKDEKAVSDRIAAILSEKSEEAVGRVDDQLSRISNEKIMAVSEFSDQLLEKMEQNHSEIIFLYNMLTEKEDEVKKLISKPIRLVETPVRAGEFLRREEKELPSGKEAISGLEAAALAAITKKEPASQKKKAAPVVEQRRPAEENKNERILKLYKEGKSVLEISKELNLGQGEVKLVIDLFQGVSG